MDDSNIIIIGANHHNTLSMIRCFGHTGIRIRLLVVGDTDGFVSKSKYVDSSALFRTAEEAVEHLIRTGGKTKNIVVSCSDDVSSILDQNYNKLKEFYTFFNCKQEGLVTKWMNKYTQCEKAMEAGLNVPFSALSTSSTLREWSLFPCIVKPLASIQGGKSLYVCNNRNELNNIVSLTSQKCISIIQEKIDIKQEIVVLGLSINNEVYVKGVVFKHREMVGGTTYSTIKGISSVPGSLVKSCSSLVQSMDYEGLFGIEFAYDGSDYRFIEINLRNDATTYALSAAGVNLPLAYYNYHKGLDWKSFLEKDVREIKSMVELRDVILLLKGKINPFAWLKQRRSAECLYFYDKEDLVPYKMERNNILKQTRKKLLRF